MNVMGVSTDEWGQYMIDGLELTTTLVPIQIEIIQEMISMYRQEIPFKPFAVEAVTWAAGGTTGKYDMYVINIPDPNFPLPEEEKKQADLILTSIGELSDEVINELEHCVKNQNPFFDFTNWIIPQ